MSDSSYFGLGLFIGLILVIVSWLLFAWLGRDAPWPEPSRLTDVDD